MTPSVRTRHADNRTEREAIVEEYTSGGYAVVSEGETTTRLRQRDHGGWKAHLLVFLIVGWWTAGLANVVYALWRRHVSTEYVEVTG